MKLARILDGVIISADSMQIYKTLDIGTAKESEANRREIKHEMIDIVSVDSEYSVAEYSYTMSASPPAACVLGNKSASKDNFI